MVIHEIGKLKFDLEFAKAQYLPEPKMLIAEKPQAQNVDTRDCAEPKRSKKCKARARPKLKKLAHHYLKSWVNIIYNCMFSNFTVIPAEPRWAACGPPEARMSLNDVRFYSN